MKSATKTIHVLYFANFREERGKNHETIQTVASTAAELYEELKNQFGFSLNRDQLRIAVNDEFKSWDAELGTDDQVAFIPPVAGG